jgi:biotin operon repressor
MKRLYATWYCKKCKTTSRDAHYQAVIDLFLLNSDKPVSNHEIRQFLELTSRTTSLKILQSLNLPQTGTGKGRRYLPPPNYKDIAIWISSSIKLLQ